MKRGIRYRFPPKRCWSLEKPHYLVAWPELQDWLARAGVIDRRHFDRRKRHAL